jgi:hypothetical protein
LSDFALADSDWDALAIPIGLAFFFKRGADGAVGAMYPSPAGPVESLLNLDAWSEIESRSDAIQRMEPDVEALLANRAASEYFVAPISATRTFFDELRRRSTPEAARA